MVMVIDGSNGITFPDTSKQYNSYYNFKNRIINGDMRIWQRGTTGTSGYTSVDRWLGTNTTSFNRSTDVPSGFQYSLEFGSASAVYIIADQRIESSNSVDLVGQKVTVSFYAKSVSGASWLGVELYSANAADNFSSTTMFASNTWLSPSSSWTLYTFTYSGTVPASAANGIQVRIYRNTDTASTTRVTGVQLEKGTQATSFDYRPYGTELALCQRYYQNIGGQTLTGFAEGSTNLAVAIFFYQQMRAAPTCSIRSGNTLSVRSPGGDYNATSPVLANTTTRTNAIWTNISGFTGLTVNAVVTSRLTNTDAIAASAEL